MKDAGSALMGIGRATGENRAVEAARQAIASPLLEVNIAGAQGILFNITGWLEPDPVRGHRGGGGDPRRGRPRGEHHLRHELQRAARRRGDDHRHRHRLRRPPPRRTRPAHAGERETVATSVRRPRGRGGRAPARRSRRDFLEELERQRSRAATGRRPAATTAAPVRRRALGGQPSRRRPRRVRRRRPRDPVVPSPQVSRGAGIARRRCRLRALAHAPSALARVLGGALPDDPGALALTSRSADGRSRSRGEAVLGGSRGGRAGRDPAAVTLVAVSKTRPADARGGVDGRADGARREPGAGGRRQGGRGARRARWHLIGPLQSNKARRAIEVVRRRSRRSTRSTLAERLDRIAGEVRPGARVAGPAPGQRRRRPGQGRVHAGRPRAAALGELLEPAEPRGRRA